MNAGRHLLLVDGDPVAAASIQELLAAAETQADTHVICADSLTRADSHLSELRVDVVLLGLRLTDAVGLPCVTAVRAMAPDVPIVVLAPSHDEDLVWSCLCAGAQDCLLTQGLRAPDLQRAIELAISHSGARREASRADVLQARLAAVVEASRDAIVSTTVDGVITEWNRSAEDLFGYRGDEALGRPVDDIIRPLDAGTADPSPGDMLNGEAGTREVLRLRRDGEPVALSVAAREVRVGDEGVVERIAVIRDITADKRAQTRILLADLPLSIHTLAESVAHAINNPLAAVLANLDLVSLDIASIAGSIALPEELVDEVADARLCAERVRRLVRELGIASQPRLTRREPLDVNAVVVSALRLVEAEVRRKARVIASYGTVPRVEGNETRLRQVVLRLIVNAVDALPDGARDTHELRITTATTAEGHASVAISDTGRGVSAEAMETLFSPYSTAPAAGSAAGMGLAVCKRVIATMGGKITVESEPGHGATFLVTIPPLRHAGPA